LRLDRLPASASVIGPPPGSDLAGSRDAAAERLRWEQMLNRQIDSLESSSEPEGAAEKGRRRAIERMLALLVRFRELEESMASRQLSEAGE